MIPNGFNMPCAEMLRADSRYAWRRIPTDRSLRGSPSLMKTIEERQRTFGEELANAITHGIGAIAMLLASPILLGIAFQHGGPSAAVSAGVFTATAVLLYMASTIYHAAPAGRLKAIFQLVDHSAIYLLIAGTYTPFLLGALRGPWGWSLFGVLWGVAVLGILQEVFFSKRRHVPSIILYLAMGWIAVVAIVPLTMHVAFAGLVLVFAGGLAYTLGVVFYAIERVHYFHTVWHLFVLAGTAFHFFAVMNYAI
jgi:hemolysin III